jgi:hypothetical protein
LEGDGIERPASALKLRSHYRVLDVDVDQDSTTMVLREYNMRVRALIAILVALSMAVVPLAAAAAAPAPVKASMAASVDCDHHAHGHAIPAKAPAADPCLAMATCGLCCAALAAPAVVVLWHDAGLSAPIEPVRLSGPALSWLTAPPLRPPRA